MTDRMVKFCKIDATGNMFLTNAWDEHFVVEHVPIPGMWAVHLRPVVAVPAEAESIYDRAAAQACPCPKQQPARFVAFVGSIRAAPGPMEFGVVGSSGMG